MDGGDDGVGIANVRVRSGFRQVRVAFAISIMHVRMELLEDAEERAANAEGLAR